MIELLPHNSLAAERLIVHETCGPMYDISSHLPSLLFSCSVRGSEYTQNFEAHLTTLVVSFPNILTGD
jgi:hypothetical protein